MSGASGTVYVLTDRAIPPRICAYFDEIILQLQLNKKVMGIILVSALDWNEQRVYWIRPDDYDGSEVSDGSRDGGPGGRENGNGNTFLGPAASLIVPLVVGGPVDATLNAAGAVDALKSTIPLTFPVYSGDGKDNDPGLKSLEFPLKTDILHLPMASLSSPDDRAIGTSGETTISSLDETSALQPQTDEISSTGKTSSTESTSERTPAIGKVTDPGFGIDHSFKTDDDISLLQRRRRALLPRDSDDCLDWLTDSDFPLNPSQLDAAAGTSADPVSPPSTQTGWNVEKLSIFAKEDVATLLVTQHDKASANENFKLDISVLDSEGNMIQNEQGVDAPTEKEIKVPVPWNVKLPINSPSIEVPFSWPLYLSTGKNKEDPIRIRYADPLLVGPETDWGLTFDSSDARHKCVVTDWIDFKREIQCSFVVAHPSLP
ncbi:hypothetical protein MMC29_000451 [Sticta canariensis]|nr:hypothetical protein [Sticta canariensis]